MIYLSQCGLCLGQPKRHLHGPVQLDSGGQLGARLLLPSCLQIEFAKAEMAVGQEWAHAEFFCQGEGLSVVDLGVFDMRWVMLSRNLAEEAQGIRLVTA